MPENEATPSVPESTPAVELGAVRKKEVDTVAKVLLSRKMQGVQEDVRVRGKDALLGNNVKIVLDSLSLLSQDRSFVSDTLPQGLVAEDEVPVTIDGKTFYVGGITESKDGKIICSGEDEDGTPRDGVSVDLSVYAASALSREEANFESSGVFTPTEATALRHYISQEQGVDPYEGKSDDEISDIREDIVIAAREQGLLTRADTEILTLLALEAARDAAPGDTAGIETLKKELKTLQGEYEIASSDFLIKAFGALNLRRSEMKQVSRYIADIADGSILPEAGQAISAAIQSGEIDNISEALKEGFVVGEEVEITAPLLEFLRVKEKLLEPNRKREPGEPERNTMAEDQLLVRLRFARESNDHTGLLIRRAALEGLQAAGTLTDSEEDYVDAQLHELNEKITHDGIGDKLADVIINNMPGVGDEQAKSIRTLVEANNIGKLVEGADNNPLLARALISTMFSERTSVDELLNMADTRTDKEKADGMEKIKLQYLLMLLFGGAVIGSMVAIDKGLQKGLEAGAR